MEKNLENTNFDNKKFELWYDKEFKIFEILAIKITNLIKEIIEHKGIKYHSVTYRIKDKDSLLNKIKNKNYKDPKSQIHDYIGIRIVTFVKSDVDKVCKEIEELFEIDIENSSNKSEELGEDKVGYRSIHYVAKVGDNRSEMPEYVYLNDKCFEIQVRTILEHAWADISHDRTYKFNKKLPEENDIRRRFALASASLEMIDREFDRLSREIEMYSEKVSEEAKRGNLSYQIDSTSLLVYLCGKFKKEIKNNIVKASFNDRDKTVIEELNALGVNTLEKLENIFSEQSKSNFLCVLNNLNTKFGPQNFITILRLKMIIHFQNKYFKDVLLKDDSMTMLKEELDIICEFYPELKKVFTESPLKIVN
ncbi:hypothetical protein HNY42_03085 [Exiguobacterium sp. Helios]|uniref:GTP pyrophosphokinase n=1 Tax=Exiguobacterium sp. Helios TaxID=2735868 RepID=UPI00165EA2A6|nr:hypothetical protein [Exiguobacterium sp. Helios]QNR19971.1 hypothetical protein HNY42_03085 [Exiguobacterium sp. Helios]